jgi:glycosyltransferase involved in cell wall biosynthesis
LFLGSPAPATPLLPLRAINQTFAIIMHNMTKISVVIPTLNEEKFISNLLGSLARQTFKPHEVIVVDCNSADKTCLKVASYAADLPLICLCAPKGISLQRNAGADRATGDVILFLDADVELQPNFLQDAGAEFKNRRLDIASAYFYADPASPKIDRIGTKAISLYHATFQYSRNPMGSGFCMFVKKTWHKRLGGFNPDFHHSEDHDYVKRAVDNGASFRILKSVQFKLSARRYVHDGRLNVLSLYTKAELNRLFFNYKFAPREKELYNFGVFNKNKSKRRSAQTQ